MKMELETTDDGSLTLYRKDIDEHYHSVKGALTESTHIYIDLGWRKAASDREQVSVFEVGFGTGLNALLTANAALECKKSTIYTAIELYPLSKETVDALLQHQPAEWRTTFRKIHEASWNEPVRINQFFTLNKIQADLLTACLPASVYDVVYFDAFAPEKQPEMWEEQIFRKIYGAMARDAILTTYCAKGSVRRMFQNIGFITERLPGPPNGKREVLRAVKHNC